MDLPQANVSCFQDGVLHWARWLSHQRHPWRRWLSTLCWRRLRIYPKPVIRSSLLEPQLKNKSTKNWQLAERSGTRSRRTPTPWARQVHQVFLAGLAGGGGACRPRWWGWRQNAFGRRRRRATRGRGRRHHAPSSDTTSTLPWWTPRHNRCARTLVLEPATQINFKMCLFKLRQN